MTQDEIIRMAREAGILEPIDLLPSNQWRQDTIRELERFANLVAEATKQECFVAVMKAAEAAVDVAIEATKEKAAKVCEETMPHPDHGQLEGDAMAGHIMGCDDCAAAIRGMK